MIRLQIVERHGTHLYRTLLLAMRSGQLRTFNVEKRGRKVTHVKYPGWINWAHSPDIMDCEVLSPQKPGSEWQLLSAFVGRLAHKYADRIHSISIQFPDAVAPEAAGRRRRAARRKR